MMIVKPKRGAEGRLRDQLYDGNSLLIECEATSPPSAVGRTVWLHIPPEQIIAMMKSARSAARLVRSEPDPTGAAPRPPRSDRLKNLPAWAEGINADGNPVP